MSHNLAPVLCWVHLTHLFTCLLDDSLMLTVLRRCRAETGIRPSKLAEIILQILAVLFSRIMESLSAESWKRETSEELSFHRMTCDQG